MHDYRIHNHRRWLRVPLDHQGAGQTGRAEMVREEKTYITALAALLAALLCLLGLCAFYALRAQLYAAEIVELKAEVKRLEARPLTIELVREEPVDKPEYHEAAWQDIGECKITHYCSCAKCCGKSDGVTASGAQAIVGRTVAVDPEVIPLGSEVLLNGVVYVAEDTGVHGRVIDVYIDSHEQAMSMGSYTTNICWR